MSGRQGKSATAGGRGEGGGRVVLGRAEQGDAKSTAGMANVLHNLSKTILQLVSFC